MGKPLPAAASAPNPLVVNVRPRHCHLTQDAVEQLFGRGHQLTVHKWLYQDGQFAAVETVTLVGPRSRVISNLRILGPCRSLNQVELARSDALALGFEIPLRLSSDTPGAPGCRLMGPAGFFELPDGVIRAARHAHMHPRDAQFYGVQHGAMMKLRLGGECGLVLERVHCRVDPNFKLEVHIDTDEANACNLQPGADCELFK
jgi:putative phosphotransacetylase